MVVVRAPGITDQRNLYCLVGVLGKDRLDLRITSDSAPLRFEVEGLLPGPLKFEAIDDIHASSAYRQHLATVMARRALEQACARLPSRAVR